MLPLWFWTPIPIVSICIGLYLWCADSEIVKSWCCQHLKYTDRATLRYPCWARDATSDVIVQCWISDHFAEAANPSIHDGVWYPKSYHDGRKHKSAESVECLDEVQCEASTCSEPSRTESSIARFCTYAISLTPLPGRPPEICFGKCCFHTLATIWKTNLLYSVYKLLKIVRPCVVHGQWRRHVWKQYRFRHHHWLDKTLFWNLLENLDQIFDAYLWKRFDLLSHLLANLSETQPNPSYKVQKKYYWNADPPYFFLKNYFI